MSESKKTTRDIHQSPRGMRDFFGELFYKKQGFFESAQKIAEYYGFSGIETPILEHTEIFLKGLDENDDAAKEMYSFETKGGDRLSLRPEGTAPIMRSYIEHGMGSLPQPLFLYYYGPFFRHEKPQKGRYRQLHQFGLEIIGSDKPVFDGIAIQAGFQILKESGREIQVKINTLGDNETREKYQAALTNFYKENIDHIADKDKLRLETNPLRILDSKEPQTIEVNKNAPTLISILNESSKQHFDQVLTYLDNAGIPYEIDHALVRGLDYYTHTVFEFVTYDTDGSASLALGGGGRYDGLAETLGHNKSVSAIGLGIGVDRTLEVATDSSFVSQFKSPHTFHLIQFGKGSRENSFNIIETFRKHNIPLSQSYTKKNLGSELQSAEENGYQQVLIFGEDEIKNNSIRIKNLQTQEQKTIHISELPEHIKNNR